MHKSVLLQTALCLPAPDIEALIQGQIITAMPRKFIHPGQKFALYPANIGMNSLTHEQYYRSNFFTIAQTIIANLDNDTTLIKAWAKCEVCKMLNDPESLEVISQLTIWTKEVFQQILIQKPYIFLAYLRVYLLSEPQKVAVQHHNSHFLPLPNSLTITEDKPVLSDGIFAQRKHQLENLQPPLHPEIEELQSAISQIAHKNPVAQQLDNDIKNFLGWNSDTKIDSINADLSWIKTIAKLGDRSIELDEKKSNYQAGTDFENITRQSLEFLGFKVENAYKGGAGGLDLYCSQPYPLVCECKAGRLIPSRTVEELIKLGGMHLGSKQFLNYTKLVIGPGNPSTDTLKSAKEWEVSIINAMTLQKLVELKAKYPGAINLVELKKYLESGQIDHKLEEYINQIEQQIKLRSDIIQVIKNYLELTKYERAGVEAIHASYMTSHHHKSLESKELYEILIELASPLTGYLGRIKGSDWRSDRFYFLRELALNSK